MNTPITVKHPRLLKWSQNGFFLAILIVATIAGTRLIDNKRWEVESVSRNVACYNAKTGEWQWMTTQQISKEVENIEVSSIVLDSEARRKADQKADAEKYAPVLTPTPTPKNHAK